MNKTDKLYNRSVVVSQSLCWCLLLCSCATSHVKSIRMYGVTVNSFTRYSIDTFNIKSASGVNLLVHRPDAFMNEFDRIISDRKATDTLEFDYRLVRILYQVNYAHRGHDKIVVDGRRCLMYKKSTYYVDDKLREFLVAPIPENGRMKFWNYKPN